MRQETEAIVAAHYMQQAQNARRAANEAQALWNSIPKDKNFWDGWYERLPEMTDVVTKHQYESAVRSAAYVTAIAEAQNVEVPNQIAPVAFLTPTEVLQDELTAAPARSTEVMRAGGFQRIANLSGLQTLIRMVPTFTQDSGRAVTGILTTATPGLNGYYRKLQLPSCDRCAVLAGKWFKHNADFDRHPRCDCVSVPAAEKDSSMEFDSDEALENGLITGLSKADTKAVLEDGANFNQVVNRKRNGMSSQWETLEGTTTRGVAGQRLIKIHGKGKAGGRYMVAKASRPTPKAIYKEAGGDKEKARILLYRAGYIL